MLFFIHQKNVDKIDPIHPEMQGKFSKNFLSRHGMDIFIHFLYFLVDGLPMVVETGLAAQLEKDCWIISPWNVKYFNN